MRFSLRAKSKEPTKDPPKMSRHERWIWWSGLPLLFIFLIGVLESYRAYRVSGLATNPSMPLKLGLAILGLMALSKVSFRDHKSRLGDLLRGLLTVVLGVALVALLVRYQIPGARLHLPPIAH
jgi:hypothetical protein